MPDTYPYTLSNNRLAAVFEKIRTTPRPKRFTYEFLKNLGFTTSNDRALIPILRALRFLNKNGTPTKLYDGLRDKNKWQRVLATQVKELYADMYTINATIHEASDDEIRGAISLITGKSAKSVNRYFATFKALAELAEFEQPDDEKTVAAAAQGRESGDPSAGTAAHLKAEPNFHYNIQIHLPATTDIAVYNAIFKSLKQNLLL